VNQRLTGAALQGGPSAMSAPPPPAGPSGADLAMGPQQQPQGGGELDQMLGAIIQAAQQAGFQMPQGEVSPEQLPQVYQAILMAAAQSDLGQSPEGQAMIQQVAQALGIGGGDQQQQPMQGMPPGGGGQPGY
jgi:hypothetical protein